MISREQLVEVQASVLGMAILRVVWRDSATGHRMEACVLPRDAEMQLEHDPVTFRLLADDSELTLAHADVLELAVEDLPMELSQHILFTSVDLLRQYDSMAERELGRLLYAEEKIPIMVRLLQSYLAGVQAQLLVHLPHSNVAFVFEHHEVAVMAVFDSARLETGVQKFPGEAPEMAFRRAHKSLLKRVQKCTGAMDPEFNLPDTAMLFINHVLQMPPLDQLDRKTAVDLYLKHLGELDIENYILELTYVANLDDPNSQAPSMN